MPRRRFRCGPLGRANLLVAPTKYIRPSKNPNMPILQLENTTFGFGRGSQRYEVFRDAKLSVEANEFVAIIGFSGSGKSTLMSLLAGLHTADEGRVVFDGVDNPPAGPRRGMVFQNYSLLPWLTTSGNIELAVKNVFRDFTRKERTAYVQRHVDLVNLTGSEQKRPHELSGGMRQRLALARTLALQPDVLLLDEPLSALDALTRSVLQDELVRLWESDRRTLVMVTNDIDEAILLADRVVPILPGTSTHLGQEFKVELDRPRSRAAVNFDPDVKRLRNSITTYMMDINSTYRSQGIDQTTPAPDITPNFALRNSRGRTVRSGPRKSAARPSTRDQTTDHVPNS